MTDASRVKTWQCEGDALSLVCFFVTAPRLRSRVRWTLIGLIVLLVGWSLVTHRSSRSESVTLVTLTSVATQFNHDYQFNDDGPVWDRFDPASQALITRARYVKWHRECPASPGAAKTLSASRVTVGWWMVSYEISGVTLHDYWHRVAGRWRFSLVRSNPAAASLYPLSFAAYAKAVGCSTL